MEVIQVAHLFPQYTDDESNQKLMAPVEEKEVEHILKAMQACWCPSVNEYSNPFSH